MKKYTYIELFAGAGGLSLGLEQSGLKNLGCFEFNKYACETLRTNRPNWNVVEEDIRKVVENNINTYIKEKQEIDILSGGFPCQAFSLAGKRLGLEDTRGTMFYYYAKAIEQTRPKVFIAENVKGLISHDKGKTLEIILETFKKLGYKVTYKVLNAVDYNVAQKRERIIIVGVRNDIELEYSYPTPNEKKLNLKDVLKNVPQSKGINFSENKKKVMELVPMGGCWVDLPKEVAIEYMGEKVYKAKGGKRGYAKRLSWDEPCLTLLCSPSQKQIERCHPEETRPLTIREYARIQDFPDEWEFIGSIVNQYKQIGNAVPCGLGKAIGISLIEFLDKIH